MLDTLPRIDLTSAKLEVWAHRPWTYSYVSAACRLSPQEVASALAAAVSGRRPANAELFVGAGDSDAAQLVVRVAEQADSMADALVVIDVVRVGGQMRIQVQHVVRWLLVRELYQLAWELGVGLAGVVLLGTVTALWFLGVEGRGAGWVRELVATLQPHHAHLFSAGLGGLWCVVVRKLVGCEGLTENRLRQIWWRLQGMKQHQDLVWTLNPKPFPRGQERLAHRLAGLYVPVAAAVTDWVREGRFPGVYVPPVIRPEEADPSAWTPV